MAQLSENALTIYRNLYYNPDETSPSDVHKRVATAIGTTVEEHTVFFNLLENNRFRPNTPCLINSKVNNKHLSKHDNNLSACFVLGLEDNMDSIMQMWSICAEVYAGGGGTGLPISNLRERGAPITSGGQASGPIEYLKVIQTISDTVKSGGKSRRAANLTSFRYNHPDIMEYIDCKKNNKLTAVNISVLVDDYFMKHVINGNFNEKIQLISPHKQNIISEITVGELWNKIIKNAWETGDPGFLFYGAANKTNALPSLGDVVASNPCGEVTLPPFSACNLGSINLMAYVFDDVFNFDKFKEDIYWYVLFLDNVISKTDYPHDNFKKRMTTERPIGLGLMGFSDLLYTLNIEYGSNESIQLFEKICKLLTKTAFEVSIGLCADNIREPITIPEEDKEHFIKRLHYFGVSEEYIEKYKKYGIRNSTVTSIAPTGSISISCDTSYAFEPCFALIWSKKLADRDDILYFSNPIFERACHERGVELTTDIKNKISKNKGSCQGIDEIPIEIQKVFKTAHDIGWKNKVKMQAAGQRWITLAISSTCNLPNSATIEDVADAYKLAWMSGLKGITVFRDGCLDWQPVNFGGIEDKKDKKEEKLSFPPELTPMKRPIRRTGTTLEINTPYGKLYITGNFTKDGNLFEVFIRMGQQGHITNILLDALGKVLSKALQYGVPINSMIDTMENCGGMNFFFKLDDEIEKSEQAQSIVDAIAKLIEYHFIGKHDNCECVDNNPNLQKCPNCKQKTLVMSAGCRGGSCTNCGYSSCG